VKHTSQHSLQYRLRQLLIGGLLAATALAQVIPASAAMTLTAQATNWRYLNVPYYHQTHGLSCEAAALQMALAAININVSQDTILNESPIDPRAPYWDASGAFHWGDPYASFVGNPDGSERGLTGYGEYYPPIVRVAQAHGASVQQAGEGIAPATLYQAVLSGHPVIAWTSFDWLYHRVSHYVAFDGRTVQFGSPYEHAVTIAGVTGSYLLINNPWYGVQWISKSTFESSYATFNNMAVILGGPAVGPGTSSSAATIQGPTPVPQDSYHALAPARILDTRTGLGGVPRRPVAAGNHVDVAVTGPGGVPVSGADTVVLNVTTTNASAAGFLTVYPSGGSPPLASNLNWRAGQTVANLVTVPIGANGMVSAYNGGGLVDVVFDLQGWYGPSPATTRDGLFNALAPVRLLDTRNSGGPLGPGQTRSLSIAGRGGVPATGAEAVVVNVTVTDATASSYLSVFPGGTARQGTSSVNFVAGQQVPNRVVVPVGAGGTINLFNAAGQVNVIVDVSGWFTDTTTVVGGSRFAAIPAQRVLDTRNGFGAIPDGGIASVSFADSLGLGVTVVVANFTVASANRLSYLTVWPGGSGQPLASDLNYAPGDTVANLVIAKLGSSAFDVYNAFGGPQLVIDVSGYYGPVTPPA